MTLIARDRYFNQLMNMVINELHGRVEGVQRSVVKSIAQSAMEGVQSKAPRQDPDLENYAQDLELVMLEEGKDISYGFVYKGKPISSSEQSTSTTILDVRPIKKKVGRWSLIFSIMGEYGPFTLNTWPLQIPKDQAYIISRTVSQSEVKQVEEKNQRDANDIRLALAKTGIRVTLHDFGEVRNDLQVEKDMAFTVMRKEMGIRVRPAPHWRPGIRSARGSMAVSKAIKNPDVMRSMLDMSYQGWSQLGMMSETVSKADLSDIQEFQSIIIKGV